MTGALGLALVALALVAIPLSRARTGDYFPPATLFLAVWSATLGLYFVRLLPYPPMAVPTASLIVGAMALFLGGAAVGRRLVRGVHVPAETGPAVMSASAWVSLYAACGLAGAAWYLYLVAVTLGWHAVDDPSSVRRALGTYQIPSAFLFLQYFCLAAPLLAAALWLAGQRLSRVALAGVVVCAGATWLTTDRTQFFTLVLGAFFMFVFSRGPRLSWPALTLASLAAAVLLASNFLIVGAWLGKTPSNLGVQLQLPSAEPDEPPASPADARVEHRRQTPPRLSRLLAKGSTLYLYASASYGALNTLVLTPGERTGGVMSVYPVARLLERLRLIDGPVPPYIPKNSPLRLQGTSHDVQFNGYTFLVYPLQDFGVAGAVLYAGITGLLCGAAYGWARRRRDSPLAMLLIGHLSIAVVLSSFVNKFNNTASWYIALASMLPLLMGLLIRRLTARSR